MYRCKIRTSWNGYNQKLFKGADYQYRSCFVPIIIFINNIFQQFYIQQFNNTTIKQFNNSIIQPFNNPTIQQSKTLKSNNSTLRQSNKLKAVSIDLKNVFWPYPNQKNPLGPKSLYHAGWAWLSLSPIPWLKILDSSYIFLFLYSSIDFWV